MLLMTAFQFSNPVTVLVGVKGDDFLFDHRRRSGAQRLDRGENSAAGLDVAIGHARGVEGPAGISIAVEKDQAAGSVRAAGQ